MSTSVVNSDSCDADKPSSYAFFNIALASLKSADAVLKFFIRVLLLFGLTLSTQLHLCFIISPCIHSMSNEIHLAT